MKIHTLKYIGWLVCMLWLVACQSQENDGDLSQASLTVTFKTSAPQAFSRAVADADLNRDGTITELEEIIDGRRMYGLAVALVENGTVIKSVTGTNVRFSKENSEATVTFEGLNYGKTYTLLAVANYGNYDANTKGNLTSADNLNGTVNVTANATSKLCPMNTPYPLSFKQEITLQPGVNTIVGELVRTYARLRIHVRNQNQNKALNITGFTLGNNFTQASTSLFKSDEMGNASVTPSVTSNHAITKFTNLSITEKTEATIFDAYLLESKKNEDYTYTINLNYDRNNKADETIAIKTIHKETGEASPIRAINRNDFIDILVNVNYNDKTGTFQFIVTNWDEKKGELEFS